MFLFEIWGCRGECCFKGEVVRHLFFFFRRPFWSCDFRNVKGFFIAWNAVVFSFIKNNRETFSREVLIDWACWCLYFRENRTRDLPNPCCLTRLCTTARRDLPSPFDLYSIFFLSLFNLVFPFFLKGKRQTFVLWSFYWGLEVSARSTNPLSSSCITLFECGNLIMLGDGYRVFLLLFLLKKRGRLIRFTKTAKTLFRYQ